MSSLCDKTSQELPTMEGRKWNLTASDIAKGVVNPIRQIVDTMKIAPNPEKELIKLTIGRFTLSRYSYKII